MRRSLRAISAFGLPTVSAAQRRGSAIAASFPSTPSSETDADASEAADGASVMAAALSVRAITRLADPFFPPRWRANSSISLMSVPASTRRKPPWPMKYMMPRRYSAAIVTRVSGSANPPPPPSSSVVSLRTSTCATTCSPGRRTIWKPWRRRPAISSTRASPP